MTTLFTDYIYEAADGTPGLRLTTPQAFDVEASLSLTPSGGNTNTGSVAWTYDVADNKFDFLADGEILTLSYTATVDDNHGGVITKPITVTVTGSNDAPDMLADISGAGTPLHAIDEQLNVTGSTDSDIASGSLAFHDVDLSDTHTAVSSQPAFGWLNLSHDTLTSTQEGVLTLASALTLTLNDSTGLGLGSVDFSYSAADGAFDFLAAGEKLTVTYDIIVADGHNAASTQPITITVTGVNDAATISGKLISNLVEDAPVASGSIVMFDSGIVTVLDVDHGEDHFQAVDAGLLNGVYGTFTFDSTSGAWTYQADPAKVQSLGQGVPVTDTLTVTSVDGTASDDIVVTITGVNDAATISGKLISNMVEDAPVASGSIVMFDSGVVTVNDVDSGEDHFQTVDAGSLNGAYGTFTFDSTSGAWTYQADPAKVQLLGHDITATDTLTVTSADGTAHEDIVVTIAGVNDAPVFDGHNLAATYQVGGAAVALIDNVTASDIDSANYAGGSLTVTDTNGFHVGDTLSIENGAIITVSGTDVMYDADGSGSGPAVMIGTLSGGGTSLTVDLNGAANDLAVTALTQAVRFHTSDTNEETRTITFTLQDGGGTANGGHDFTRTEATVDVTVPESAGTGPVIATDLFTVAENENGTTTVLGLYVTDTDATVPDDEDFTLAATTGASPQSSADPSSGSGDLSEINATLSAGITYNPGEFDQPDTDSVTFTVTDGFDHSDTVNFIFNQAGQGPDITLTGTPGKDVIFATGHTDTLIGGLGADQFVFRIGDGNDTITDFAPGQDHIDLRAFFATVDTGNIVQWLAGHAATSTANSADVLITLDEDDSITLKNVAIANLSANDFVLHPGGGQ